MLSCGICLLLNIHTIPMNQISRITIQVVVGNFKIVKILLVELGKKNISLFWVTWFHDLKHLYRQEG